MQKTVTWPADLEASYDPDTHLLSRLEVTSHQGGATTVMDLAYDDYDELGNLEHVLDQRPGAGGLSATATYTYAPNRNRLKSRTLGGETRYFAYL
jgi:hypothetical protein